MGMIEWANDVLEHTYSNLKKAVKDGEVTIKNFAGSAKASAQWIWEALQGDFNPNQTVGQIAANVILGLVPIVDTILDIRDLIANCKTIYKDKSNVAAWAALALTIVGFIPELGSVIKGVFKIFVLVIRKYGGDLALKHVDEALQALRLFLQNEKTQSVLKILFNLKQAPTYKWVVLQAAQKLKSVRGQINAQTLLDLFDKVIAKFDDVMSSIRYLTPQPAWATISESRRIVGEVRRDAKAMFSKALQPVQQTVDKIIIHLEKEGGLSAATNVRTPHAGQTARQLTKKEVRFLSSTKKGLYGEIISDEYMRKKGYAQLLPEGRYARSLEDIPKGRGLDGVYENPKHLQPPKYTITETKYRQTNETTGKNQYIDRDGNAGDTALGMTKGSGRQMSSTWIQGNLKSEFKNHPYLLEELEKPGAYQSLLMIVDQSGSVVAVSKLDSAGKTIRNITP